MRILVSSRSSLRVSGEQECPVPPLEIPELEAHPTAASLAACDSVRLFAERAAAAVPGFTVSNENARVIAQIACRLDGLPLAIELAAARVKLLPPEAILPRLEHSLGLLTAGRRDLEDRQQTLRATIAWSHDLLTAGAGRLLATCSVFAGGAGLEAIETVCDAAVDIGLPVLDGLQELVDQSLLRHVRGPGLPAARYAMLETIREYAAEHLDAMPEAEQVRGAHAAAFLALVEVGGRPHAGLARSEWLERVDIEGVLEVERAVALVNETGDRSAIAFVTFYSAVVALLAGRPEAACDLFARVGALAAELGLAPLSARARLMLAYPLLDLGELSAARTALAEGFQMSTDVGDRWFVQLGLGAFAGLAVKTGRPRLALRLAGAAEAYRDANKFSFPGPMEDIVTRWLCRRAPRPGGRPGG